MDREETLERVCINPELPKENEQSVRCDLCMKPLVAAKSYTRGGKNFCCEGAASQHDSSQKTFDDHNAREKKRKRLQFVKKIVFLVIIGILAYCGYTYWSQNKDQLNDVRKELQEKAKDLDSTIKKNID